MKKQFLGVAALASVFAGLAGTGRTVSANTQTTIQQNQDNGTPQKGPINPIKQQKIDITNPRPFVEGPGYEHFFDYGVSPKEWGMYLQRTGRQKWNKKSPKKPR